MKRKLLFLSLLWCTPFILIAQTNEELKADSLSDEEQYEEANLIYSDIINNKEVDPNTFLRISTNLAVNLQQIGGEEESIGILEKAIAQSEGKSVLDSIKALAYHKLAVAHYYAFEDDEAAIQFWQKALDIREDIFPTDHFDIIKGYRNIGTSLFNLKRYDQSNEYLKKSLDLHLSKNSVDSVLLGRTYKDLAYTALDQEDFNKAFGYLNGAKKLYEDIFQNEPWELVDIYESLFDFYQKNENGDKMFFYSKRIIDSYEGIEDLYEEDSIYIAGAYNNLGLALEKNNEYERSISSYLRSIQLYKENNKNRDAELGMVYANVALPLLSLRKYDDALSNIEQAISLAKNSGDNPFMAKCIDNKAEILLSKGQPDEALVSIQKAEKIFLGERKLRDIDKPSYAILQYDKMRIYQSLARKQNKVENLQKAAQVADEIVILFDEIRFGFQSDASKSFLTKKAKKVFETAIAVFFELYEFEEENHYLIKAFEFAERSKSLILLEAIARAGVQQKVGVPNRMIKKEKYLKKKFAELEKQLFQSDTTIDSLQKEQIIVSREMEKLKDTLEISYPEYYGVKYKAFDFSISKIQENLDGDLIEYLISDSLIYAFVLTKEKLEALKIEKTFPLKQLIQDLRKSVYEAKLNNKRSEQNNKKSAEIYVESAYQLFESIFKPIQDKVDLSERISISTDGILGYIPFDLLLSKIPQNNLLYGTHKYLLKEYEISYIYSAIYLNEVLLNKNKGVSNSLLAFAPSFEKSKDLTDKKVFKPLIYNNEEVEAIQGIIGGDVLEGKNATLSNFIAEAPNYQFLHLATHGQANDTKGDFAFLAFTNNGNDDESLLYNSDLYNLNLNADLVVLSACETGIGELQEGEGIISLARGFSYAGAKSVVTTLWSINDEKTKEVMVRFYENLSQGSSKSSSLRKAKLDFISKYSHNAHPFYWAAFVPIGDMASVSIAGPSFHYILAGVCLIFGLFAVGFFFKRQS